MKITAKLFFLIGISLIVSSAALAAEIEKEGTPLRKLQRGFLNLALCPFEISNELSKEMKNDAMPPGWAVGLGRGSIYMVGRALTGVYEMVTFPLPAPAGYRPILHPEFPWQYVPSPSEKKQTPGNA